MLLEVLPGRFAGLCEKSGTNNRICTNSGPILIEFGIGLGYFALKSWSSIYVEKITLHALTLFGTLTKMKRRYA